MNLRNSLEHSNWCISFAIKNQFINTNGCLGFLVYYCGIYRIEKIIQVCDDGSKNFFNNNLMRGPDLIISISNDSTNSIKLKMKESANRKCRLFGRYFRGKKRSDNENHCLNWFVFRVFYLKVFLCLFSAIKYALHKQHIQNTYFLWSTIVPINAYLTAHYLPQNVRKHWKLHFTNIHRFVQNILAFSLIRILTMGRWIQTY